MAYLGLFYGAIAVPSITLYHVVVVVDIGARRLAVANGMGPTFFKCFLFEIFYT